MGLLERFTRRPAAAPVEARSLATDGFAAGGLFMLDQWGSADTGVTVTPENALQAASVWACVSRIARDLSTLPLHVIDRQTDRRVPDHPVAQLVRTPNPYQAGPSFLMAYLVNLLLYGGAGIYLDGPAGRYPAALYPLMSRSVQPGRIDGELIYRVSYSHTLRADQVAAVAYMLMDGVMGTSPIRLGSRAIGTDIALAQFAAKFFSQGANVGTVFELPPLKDGAAIQQVFDQLKAQHQGNHNAHRLIAIPGVKVHKTANSPRDSQAVEARQHQLGEVARLFNMPIGLLDAERSKYAGLEAQYRDYAQATLRPWAVLIESEWSRKLFPEADQGRYALRFNLDAIVRADLSVRAEADAKLVQAGIMTANEARAHHDLPAIDGGDRLLSPLNMAPADQRSGQAEHEHRSEPPADDSLLLGECIELIAGVQSAQRQVEALTRSIAEGIASKEQRAIQTAAKRHEDLTAWAAEWFEAHREHIRSRLPILEDDAIEELIVEARSAIADAQAAGEVEVMVAGWKKDRLQNFFSAAGVNPASQKQYQQAES